MLSSNILHFIIGALVSLITPCLAASFANEIRGRISRAADDNAIYSASVTDGAISVYILDDHIIG
jgi:hypothetical protein